MSYKRADEILPIDILKALQMYVNGETIYVPKLGECRKEWGSNTGVKESLRLRNERIWLEYQKGVSTGQLANTYCLTEKSIQRILRNIKKQPPIENEMTIGEKKN